MNFIFNYIHTKLSALKAVAISFLLVVSLNAAAQHTLPGKIHFGLIYPLSTNGTHAPLDTNTFSINLLGGISAAERGLSFAGITNVIRHDAKGLQFAGFSNHIGKKAEGLQFAGFMNTYGEGKGLAFAGFTNVAAGNIKGAQMAGFANVAKNVNGAQFSGFINIAKNISASQFTGFINIAKDVKGSQFAGFINVAKKVKGAQFAGFINIADSSDFPVGIVNIIKNGEKSIGLSIDENQTTLISLRSGGRVLYGILGIGYNFKNYDEVYAIEAGMGAHFFQSKDFRLNAELASGTLENFKKGTYFKTSFRLMPALKITPFLEIFGGPVFNYVNTNTIEGRSLNNKYIHSWENKWGNNFQGLYIGYTGAIQVIF